VIPIEMLVTERSHPYYWASFIPSGDWTAIDPNSILSAEVREEG